MSKASKDLVDLPKYLLIILYIITGSLSNFGAIDILAPQWIYLASINLLSCTYILFFSKDLYYGSITKLFKTSYIYIYIFYIVWNALSYFYAVNQSETLINLPRLSNTFFAIVFCYLLISRITAKLTTVAPTALDEVGTITLTSLPKLTSINLASMVTLPILGAYTITISDTGLTASFGIASEATTTTQAYSEKIYSNDLMTLKPLMTLAAATSAVTYTFAGDVISSVSTRVFDADGVPSAVSATGTMPLMGADSSTANILAKFKNAASKVSTPVSEEDFVYVVAE